MYFGDIKTPAGLKCKARSAASNPKGQLCFQVPLLGKCCKDTKLSYLELHGHNAANKHIDKQEDSRTQSHALKHTPYLSLKKRRKPKAISLSIASSTKVEVKK